jgi:hypothetical protein
MEDMKTNRIQQSYDSPEFLKLIAASNAEVFYVISGHTDFLRVDENGREEWVRCGAGDTLVASMNALHAFHNRTDKPTRLISSSLREALRAGPKGEKRIAQAFRPGKTYGKQLALKGAADFPALFPKGNLRQKRLARKNHPLGEAIRQPPDGLFQELGVEVLNVKRVRT